MYRWLFLHSIYSTILHHFFYKSCCLLAGVATLQVNINDVNDNPPYFPQQQYKAEVEETAPKGELVTNIRAEDRDIDNNFQYIIVTGNDNQAFEITNTGDLVVFDSGRLDYETNKVSLTYLY